MTTDYNRMTTDYNRLQLNSGENNLVLRLIKQGERGGDVTSGGAAERGGRGRQSAEEKAPSLDASGPSPRLQEQRKTSQGVHGLRSREILGG